MVVALKRHRKRDNASCAPSSLEAGAFSKTETPSPHALAPAATMRRPQECRRRRAVARCPDEPDYVR